MVPQPEPPDAPPGPQHLAATRFLDAGHPDVVGFARRVTAGAATETQRAARLFAAVRDGLRYDPYTCSADPGDYVASTVLGQGQGYCIPKSVVLAAAARAVGIPARLGFADVRNHLQSERLLEAMGTDLFVFHGYAELHVGGAWRKASCAFNRELCERFSVAPLEFDGAGDALLHAFSGDGRRYMEYVHQRGSYADLPLGEILAGLEETYPGFLMRAGRADDPAFGA